MKIAILHHHLNRGGVTQVVLSHIRALQIAGQAHAISEILVLHGGRADGLPNVDEEFTGFPVSVVAVSGLDYDDAPELRTEELGDAIALALAAAGFGADETILHVHNHSLGKNVSLPGALRQLAERGYRLLLQVHDFAEDWRPDNYNRFRTALGKLAIADVGGYLYPIAPQIHYAFLNSRDRAIFLTSNVDPGQVHLLPNPATAAASLPPHDQALKRFQTAHGLSDSQRLVLYPVRGIRRKNLGEMLLWAALGDEQSVFAVTLPASSAVERPAYKRWRQLAERLKLRILFDVGMHDQLSFEDNLAAADRIITTSVAEGFGLVFLECWLHQRLLIGRNLPEITDDFRLRGVNLDHLGNSLEIPIDWVGAEAFVVEALKLQQQLCTAYGQDMPETAESVLRNRVSTGLVDFAALTTRLQTVVIEHVVEDRAAAKEIMTLNPWLQVALEFDDGRWQSLIEENAAAVRTGFSLESTLRDLNSIYGTLFASTADQVSVLPQPHKILSAFLDVNRICPVRIEP